MIAFGLHSHGNLRRDEAGKLEIRVIEENIHRLNVYFDDSEVHLNEVHFICL